MSDSEGSIHTITGRGLVSAEGCEPVRVRYRLIIDRGAGEVTIRGTLTGRHAGLRPIWLEPDAQLRLKTGRTLAVSLTDLVGDVAEFETVGPVPDL